MDEITIDARQLDQEGFYPPVPTLQGAWVHNDEAWVGRIYSSDEDGTWTALVDGSVAPDWPIRDLEVTGLETRGEAARMVGAIYRAIRVVVDTIDGLGEPS